MKSTLGDAVRQSRKLRKISQTELSTMAGVSRSAIVALEGSRGRMATLVKILPHCPVNFSGLPPAPTLAGQIKMARQLAGYSIPVAASRSEVSSNTIRSIEAGNGNVAAFVAIASAVTEAFHPAPVKPKKPRIWRTVAGKFNRHRDPADYYSTPVHVTRSLLESVDFDREATVLEPCLGEARAIEHVLNEVGFENVTVSDIQASGDERRDFFDIKEPYDFIITNPPFSNHLKWIAHAKTIARKKIALLLPLNYLSGAERLSSVWSDRSFPLAQILVFNRGLDFLTDPFREKLRASQLYCAWFVWDIEHVGEPRVRWLDIDGLIQRKSPRTLLPAPERGNEDDGCTKLPVGIF